MPRHIGHKAAFALYGAVQPGIFPGIISVRKPPGRQHKPERGGFPHGSLRHMRPGHDAKLPIATWKLMFKPERRV